MGACELRSMAQSRFQARLTEEFQASKSLVMESQDTLSLRDVRRLLADRLGAPQKAVDDEKRLVASLVDEAIQEHSGANVQVMYSNCIKLSFSNNHCVVLIGCALQQVSANLTQLASNVCLPPEMWSMILQKLDLSSGIAAMQVTLCKQPCELHNK